MRFHAKVGGRKKEPRWGLLENHKRIFMVFPDQSPLVQHVSETFTVIDSLWLVSLGVRLAQKKEWKGCQANRLCWQVSMTSVVAGRG